VRLFQARPAGLQPGPPPEHLLWQGQALPLEAFRRAMVAERRLIYRLEPERAYGMSAT